MSSFFSTFASTSAEITAFSSRIALNDCFIARIVTLIAAYSWGWGAVYMEEENV